MTASFKWRCRNKSCEKYSTSVSIRKKSFFGKSKITLMQCTYGENIHVSVQTASNLIGIGEKATIDAFNFFRQICGAYLEENSIRLGGVSQIVEIDESCCSHKVKHHRGRGPLESVWVFGIIQRNSNTRGIGYLEIVKKRDAGTLLPIIENIVVPGTTIHSDEWKAYNRIQDMGYVHRTVCHKCYFCDPETRVHINGIESYWNKCQSAIKTMRGCRRSMLQSYLNEFMWRDRFDNSAFDNLCLHMSNQYKLN